MADVFLRGDTETDVEIYGNADTKVEVDATLETDVVSEEEEKIDIEVEQNEPVDVKIDGQIYEVGGGNGQDGFSPIVEVEEIEGGHRVTITDIEGTKVFDVMNGQNGEDGYTPQKGVDYFDGKNGEDGYTPVKGIDYFDGKDGQDGRDGIDGYTPIKGVDYFTDKDKEEFIQGFSSVYDIDGNGQVDKADNSDKLGGQLPSYYAKASDIPFVPTKVSAFDNDVGYLTEHQSLENYPTKQEVAEGLNKKQDSLDRFVESINGYSGEVNLSAGDVHALPDTTVIPTVPSVVSAFVNDADYASKTYVSEVAAGKCKAYTFSTVDELDLWLDNEENTSKLNNGDVFYIRAVGVPDYWWDGETQSKQILETTKVDLAEYAKLGDIPSNVSQLHNDAKYTTEADVDTKLSGKQDKLTSYVSSVNGKSGAVSLNATDVGALPDNTVIPTVPTKVSAFQNDAGYLTQHQDLSAYAKKSDIPTVPTKVSAFENDKGYLTQHQDLSAYAKKTELPTALSQLSQDSTHRIVTDTEKATWNAKSNLAASNKGYNGAITAGADGVAEMGKYIDFHNTASGTSDYSTRLVCTGEHGNTVNLPSATGTLVAGDRALKIVITNSAPTTNDTSVMTIQL